MGQHLIIVQQDPLIQLHPAAFVFTPKLVAEIDAFFDEDQLAILQRSHFRIGGVRALINLDTGGAEYGGIDGNFHGLIFISMDAIRASHFKVIRMFQRDPAFIETAPQIAALFCQAGNQQLFTSINRGYDATGDTGCLAHIHVFTGYLNLYTAFRVCGLIGSHRTQFPMGIQGDAVGGLIQRCDPGATGCCGKPANESITCACRHRHRRSGHIAVITLGAAIPVAAIGIELYIAIAFGQFRGICTIQIDIGFHHTATQQTIEEIATGRTPLTHGEHKIIAFCPSNNGLNYRAFIIPKHRRTNIIHKRNQGIELMLFQLDLLADHEGIHIRHKLGKLILHQLISFLRCYTVFPIPLQILIRTSGAEAHGPLTVVPERNGIKALHLFN